MNHVQSEVSRGELEVKIMGVLPEGTSVKGNPQDKRACGPCIRGSAKILLWMSVSCFT